MLNKEEIGKNIKELRMKIGLSQENLDKALNKSDAAISYIEKGKIELTVGDLDKIANALNTSIYELLGIPPNFSTSFQFYGSISKQVNFYGYKLEIISNQENTSHIETTEVKETPIYPHL